MKMQTLLKARLITFWPMEEPVSTKTMVGYSEIDVMFEESKLEAGETADLDYKIKDIAMMRHDTPIDVVQKEIGEVYQADKQKLSSMGLLTPDPERRRTFILRLESIAEMDTAREKTAVRMVEDYLAKKNL